MCYLWLPPTPLTLLLQLSWEETSGIIPLAWVEVSFTEEHVALRAGVTLLTTGTAYIRQDADKWANRTDSNDLNSRVPNAALVALSKTLTWLVFKRKWSFIEVNSSNLYLSNRKNKQMMFSIWVILLKHPLFYLSIGVTGVTDPHWCYT